MKLTSCGGTLNVAVRKSTLIIVSTHGKMKNKPGPFAPPEKKRGQLTSLLYKFLINFLEMTEEKQSTELLLSVYNKSDENSFKKNHIQVILVDYS